MKLTAALPEPCPKQPTPLSPGEFVLCTYSAWTRNPRHYCLSTKTGDQILLTTLLSLWALRDMPDGKSQQVEWTLLIPAGKAVLFSAVSVLHSALLYPLDHQSQQTVASHLVQVAKVPANKAFERQVRDFRLPATHAALMAASAQQCCTSFSMSSKLACVCWCPWASTSMACISTLNEVRHDICRHNYTVERGLLSASVVIHTVVTDPSIQQPGFDFPHHTWSLMNCFRTGHLQSLVGIWK